MKNQLLKTHPSLKMLSNLLVELPAPTSISYMWNWGSMLGLMMVTQLVSGILLASHYSTSIETAFDSIVYINQNVTLGYMLRFLHMNGASLFFIIIFIHISRGLLFSSFKYKTTWMSGTFIVLILMGTAFLGYVLPWGQMSFWGTTVITSLLSAIPYVGQEVVQWLWGGFAVGGATLNRFFALHFLMPFVLMALIIMHLASLHMTGSNKPSGANPNLDKIPFFPFFSDKDILGVMTLFLLSTLISFCSPYFFSDPENFNPANPLNTPTQIEPEWYFLFAYAILRSIPNKLGGVIALVMAIVSLVFLTLLMKPKSSKKFMPTLKMNFWAFSTAFLVLTLIGASPVETPFEMTGKLFSLIYFALMFMN